MTTIYVGNLPIDAEAEILQSIFSRYGRVTGIEVVPRVYDWTTGLVLLGGPACSAGLGLHTHLVLVDILGSKSTSCGK